MKSTHTQLVDFLDKAYQLTQQALKAVQDKDYDKLNTILDNRERAINIVNSLSENLALHYKNANQDIVNGINNQVSQIINKIESLDEIIASCLEFEKNKTQFEIAKTFKNKENLKGYNLNNLK